MKIGRHTLPADCRGGVAVEFALIAPMLLLLLFGIVEFGRLVWTQAALHSAVEAAARCAAIDAIDCGSASAVQAYAVRQAAGLNLASSVFSLATPACGAEVTASYPFQFVVGQIFPYAITLTAQSCFPK